MLFNSSVSVLYWRSGYDGNVISTDKRILTVDDDEEQTDYNSKRARIDLSANTEIHR